MANSLFKWLYVTRTNGIQAYLTKVSKLKHIIGGSELIDSLASLMLDSVLPKMRLQIDEDYKVVRKSGGEVMLIFQKQDDALSLAEIWPFLVQWKAPGVEIVQTVVEANDFAVALDRVHENLRLKRQIRYPSLPPASPLMHRNRRTGLKVVQINKKLDSEEVYLDRESLHKLEQEAKNREELHRRIGLISDDSKRVFARKFEDIAPEKGQYMAVIHADANELGKKIMAIVNNCGDDEPGDRFFQFSKVVEETTEFATREALQPIIDEYENEKESAVIPIRLVVCAGDDLTVVIPGEYTHDFVEKYITTFEQHYGSLKKKKLKWMSDDENLSVSVGIAFVKSSYPISSALGLAESLCKYTKKQLKRKVSGFSFHRVTTSSVSDFETILDREYTIQKGATGLQLTMMPYTLEPVTSDRDDTKWTSPTSAKLRELCNVFDDLPKGSIRKLFSTLYTDRLEAERSFTRMKKVSQDRDGTSKAFSKLEIILDSLRDNHFTNADSKLWTGSHKKTRKGEVPKEFWCTPVMDALELRAVNKEFKTGVEK